jgi:hypothetical protein
VAERAEAEDFVDELVVDLAWIAECFVEDFVDYLVAEDS